jgi:hypothetical protein
MQDRNSQETIERFRALLKRPLTEDKRKIIAKLLAREEAKRRTLVEAQRSRPEIKPT